MNTLFDLTEHNILYLEQNEQMLQDYDKLELLLKKKIIVLKLMNLA